MGADINKIIRMRDVEIAEGMGKLADLGWFDVEFTVYGTAYYDGKEMCYRVSEMPDFIYHFMENKGVEDLYFGNVLSLTQRCPVPVGMKEDKALEVKKELASLLRENYPKELFLILNKIAEEARQDDAYDILLEMQEQIEGCFDELKLQLYQKLVDYSYDCLKLSKVHYAQICEWIRSEYKNMEDDSTCKDIFEKNFYGIVYLENDKFHYLEDSVREYIYQRKYQMEQKGIMATPVFQETIQYNYVHKLLDARKDFMDHFHKLMNENYLDRWQRIRTRNTYLSNNDLQDMIERIAGNLGDKAVETLTRYMYRWCFF